jgi:hypothetical protein
MNTSASNIPKGQIAAWKRAPFDRFFDYTKQAHRLFHLTVHGIHILTTQDKLVEALVAYDNVVRSQDAAEGPSAEVPSDAAKIEAAHEEAVFARMEVESDFRRLRVHSLLDQWGALEVLVEDVIVAWLRNMPELLGSDEVARVRIPFGEFQQLDDDQRYKFLAQELTRDKKANLKAGATRFEMMLALVGLDGFAHRGGLADRQLLKACPWISVRAGEPVPLGAAESNRYELAVIDYAMAIFIRARDS